MAKWWSPIFSDIRNKLGENVVFSQWKGRPYMRSYVVPANPQTNAQTAERAHMAAIVDMYQQNVKGTGAHVTAWNEEALKDLISGYNQFTKYGRGITFGAVDLTAAGFSIEVTASKIPNDRLAVMVWDHTLDAYHLPTTPVRRGLDTYVAADYAPAYAIVADDKAFIVDTKVLSGADVETDAEIYKAVNGWQVDQSSGVITELLVTV
jgi:hypothetical protein